MEFHAKDCARDAENATDHTQVLAEAKEPALGKRSRAEAAAHLPKKRKTGEAYDAASPGEPSGESNVDADAVVSKTAEFAEETPVIEFCDKNNIAWFPIHLKYVKTNENLADGSVKIKKEMMGRPRPKTTYFDDNLGEIIKRKLLLATGGHPYTHIAMDTHRVKQVDIDCVKYSDVFQKMLGTHPFTKSSTKPFGRHILVVDPSLTDHRKEDGTPHRIKENFREEFGVDHRGNAGVELLNGLWAWCPLDAVVYNSNKAALLTDDARPEIALGPMLKSKAKKHKKTTTLPFVGVHAPVAGAASEIKTARSPTFDAMAMRKVLKRVPMKHFADYADWVKIGAILHFESKGSESGVELWDEFSQQSDKYEAGCCQAKWSSFGGRRDTHATMGTLKHWAVPDMVEDNLLAIAAALLAGKYSGRLLWCQDQLFLKHTRGWFTNEKIVKRLLFSAITIMDLHVRVPSKDPAKSSTIVPVATSNRRIKDLIELLVNKAPVNDDFREELWHRTVGKVYFQNGYLDFRKGELCEQDFETTIVVNRDLDMTKNDAIRQQIYTKVLNPIFTVESEDSQRAKLRDYWLKKTARAIAGEYLD